MDVQAKYNFDLTGGTDNADKLAQMAADIANRYSTQLPLPSLRFPEGDLFFSSWPDLAYDGLKIIADGQCRLHYTGLGDGIVFDGSKRNPSAVIAPNQPGINNLTFEGFEIIAASSGASLKIAAVHRSNISAYVRSWGVRTALEAVAIKMIFCVCTKLHPVVSGSENITGLSVDAWPNRPELQSTACVIDNPILEGCTTGLYMASAGNFITTGGTIESCANGIEIIIGGHNRFSTIDMEGNKNKDVICGQNAHNNLFVNCGTNGKLKADFGSLFSWNRAEMQ